MSIAENLTGEGLPWFPTVTCLALAFFEMFFFGSRTVAWLNLYIVSGLGIGEIVSKLFTKHTLSQNLYAWPPQSIRDYILYFAFLSFMLLAMVSLAFPDEWISTALYLIFGAGCLIWGKQYFMAGYIGYVLIGYGVFVGFFGLSSELAALSPTIHSIWVGLMVLSMFHLGFHTWRRYVQ